MHVHALRAVMVDRDVRGLGDDQIDVAVQSAVDVDVARRRKHVEPGRVVDDRPQQVLLAVAQVAGQLERESPEPAAMFPDVTAVDDQVGNRPGAREADEDALVAPLERHLDVLHVVAHAPEVVVLAAERIVVPCVGQVHVLGPVAASLAVAEEPPVAVEVDDFARRQPEARGQQHEENSRFFHVVRFTDKINTKPEKPSSDLVSILLCLRLGIREYAIDGKNIVHTATGIRS